MAEDALVSILTPSYNQGRFIRDTLESVLRQDYPRVEHIVADGGSTDETLSILTEYRDTIRYTSQPDSGQADALNRAFSHARGSIIGWLNSDDFYLWDGAVGCAVALFEKLPDVDVVYGDAVWVDEENRLVKIYPRPSFSAPRLCRFDYLSQPATFFRSSIVEPPLVSRRLEYALDYQLWLGLLHANRRFVHCPVYLAAMRYHPSAKSVRTRSAAWDEDATLERTRGTSGMRAATALADLALMAWMKARGLADFRPGPLHAPRWTVPLSLPSRRHRLFYQLGIRGSRGTALLLPRFLLARHRNG
jgi:glycosyltransferase involved in cell wall biosynthesis